MKPYSEQDRFSQNTPQTHASDELDKFFSEAYHDMRFFLETITKHKANSYAYFGDLQKQIYYISDNLRDEFGFESNLVYNLLDEWEKRIYRANGVEKYRKTFRNIFEKKLTVHDLRYQVQNKEGKVLWVRCCGEVQWNEDRTKPLFFAGRMSKQDDSFVVDPITNFPSGSAIVNHLSEMQERNISGYAVGFCYNNMSRINTMMGRNVVDQSIRDISEQLMDELFEQVSFYRLPGVRCMASVEKESGLDRDELIAKIRDIVEKNFARKGIQVPYPCSFAYMKLPQPDMKPTDLREKMVSLLKMARHNQHLPYIKDSKENTEKLFEYSKMEMVLCQDVLDGMNHFRAVIQPVVKADSGKILAGETLMRWQFEGKDMSPAVFIPVLEKNNMIHIAGRWVFSQAVKACSEVVRSIPEFYLTVNVSLQQLYDEGFGDYIRETLEKYHLEGSHIVIEMTESCMDSEPEKLMELMTCCQKLGIRFALDDFGTGYSSLRVLLHYPTDIIKLDRSLLLEMTESRDKMNFISSIVFACHRFEKLVCIEGVETKVQDELVKNASCDMIQGFYYYKPTELDTLYQMVKEC